MAAESSPCLRSVGRLGKRGPVAALRPLRDAPRVRRASGGLLIVRSDGTAALGVDYVLVDLATGATSTVPRLSPLEVPYLAVRL